MALHEEHAPELDKAGEQQPDKTENIDALRGYVPDSENVGGLQPGIDDVSLEIEER